MWRRYALTGGPHSGKSTLLEKLKQMNLDGVSEAAIEVIDELRASMGEESLSLWRKGNIFDFQMKVFARQKEKDRALDDSAASTSKPVFMDRTAIDCIAYLELGGIRPPAELITYAGDLNLTEVFVLQTIEPFDCRESSGRESTLHQSWRIRDQLIDVYTRLGHRPRLVPALSIEDRVEAVTSVAGSCEAHSNLQSKS